MHCGIYLKHRRGFQKTNIIFQTLWRIYFLGRKYDAFTDMGLVSWVLVKVLELFFEVVEVSYSEEETVKIVKKHVNASEMEIKKLIKRYGFKPLLYAWNLIASCCMENTTKCCLNT